VGDFKNRGLSAAAAQVAAAMSVPEKLGPWSQLAPRASHFRSPTNGHQRTGPVGPVCANCGRAVAHGRGSYVLRVDIATAWLRNYLLKGQESLVNRCPFLRIKRGHNGEKMICDVASFFRRQRAADI
jgi:hypothetical protein